MAPIAAVAAGVAVEDDENDDAAKMEDSGEDESSSGSGSRSGSEEEEASSSSYASGSGSDDDDSESEVWLQPDTAFSSQKTCVQVSTIIKIHPSCLTPPYSWEEPILKYQRLGASVPELLSSAGLYKLNAVDP
jgi:hypothetical protein